MVLVDGLPGEEQEQQQHGDTEDCGAPPANHRTQPTQAMSYQDTIAHTRRGEEVGSMEEGKTEGANKVEDYAYLMLLDGVFHPNLLLRSHGCLYFHLWWLLWLPIKHLHHFLQIL